MRLTFMFLLSGLAAASAFGQALTLQLPTSAAEGDGLRANAAQVRLETTATSNVVVSLSSSDSNSVRVPPATIIAAGLSNATFDLDFPDNGLTDGTRTVVVSATAPGFIASTNSILVYDNDPHHVKFSMVPSPQYAGSNFTLTITIEDIAGRRLTNFNSALNLVADSVGGTVAVTPATAGLFKNGQWNGTLRIDTTARLVRLRSPTLPGESSPFHVEPQPFRVLSLPTVDIGVRRQSGAIYATVPPNGGLYANKLIVMDPNTLTVTNSFSLGDDPRQLEIAPNGQFLYASISNRTSLRRLDLNSHLPSSQINLGPGSWGALHVTDFAVSGSGADQVALTSSDDGGNNGPVRIYTGGVSQSAPSFGLASPYFIEASPSSAVFYAFEANNSFPFLRFTTASVAITNGLLGQWVQFTMRSNIAYTTAGRAVNGDTFQLIGDYPGAGGPVEVDPALRRTFYVKQFGSQYRVLAFDRDSRTLLTSLSLPPLGGAPGRLLRSGLNGFVCNAGSQLWFIDSNQLLPTNTPADLRISQSLSPTPPILGSNVVYSITVSNAGPGDATFVRVSNTLPANVTLVSSLASTGAVTQIAATLTWDILHLAPLQLATMSVTVVPNSAGWQTNGVVASAYEHDSDFANNMSRLPSFVQLSSQMSGAAPLNLAVEDLVYDSSMNRLLLSVGSGNGGNSNGIAIFNPTNGLTESFVSLGSHPSKLARSSDGQFLYVSLPDLAVVRRLSLPTFSFDLQFNVGGETIYGSWYPWFAADLAVLPSQPHSIAISRVRKAGQYADEFHQGVAVFDNGVLRGNATETCRCSYALEFSGPGTLCASRGDGAVDKLVVDENGVTLAASAPIAGPSSELSAASRLIYSSAGRVFDPETLQYLGAFNGADLGSAVVADGVNARVHYVSGSGPTGRRANCLPLTQATASGSDNCF
jgi:uncharacterized repeat protein (TIGR01451 family)